MGKLITGGMARNPEPYNYTLSDNDDIFDQTNYYIGINSGNDDDFNYVAMSYGNRWPLDANASNPKMLPDFENKLLTAPYVAGYRIGNLNMMENQGPMPGASGSVWVGSGGWEGKNYSYWLAGCGYATIFPKGKYSNAYYGGSTPVSFDNGCDDYNCYGGQLDMIYLPGTDTQIIKSRGTQCEWNTSLKKVTKVPLGFYSTQLFSRLFLVPKQYYEYGSSVGHWFFSNTNIFSTSLSTYSNHKIAIIYYTGVFVDNTNNTSIKFKDIIIANTYDYYFTPRTFGNTTQSGIRNLIHMDSMPINTFVADMTNHSYSFYGTITYVHYGDTHNEGNGEATNISIPLKSGYINQTSDNGFYWGNFCHTITLENTNYYLGWQLKTGSYIGFYIVIYWETENYIWEGQNSPGYPNQISSISYTGAATSGSTYDTSSFGGFSITSSATIRVTKIKYILSGNCGLVDQTRDLNITATLYFPTLGYQYIVVDHNNGATIRLKFNPHG